MTPHDVHTIAGPAALSVSSAAVSFFSETLPVIQWMAGVVAILSGLVAIAWVVYKYLKLKRDVDD